MRYIIIIFTIAILFANVPTAQAQDNNVTVSGYNKGSQYMPVEKIEKIREHTPRILMQDLTQCKYTFDGQFVCVDVCGGLSVPYTICSYE